MHADQTRSSHPPGARADARLSAPQRARRGHGRDLAAEYRPGLHDAQPPRARRVRGARRGVRGAPHLPDHGRRSRRGDEMVRGAGDPRGPPARRARDQARARPHGARGRHPQGAPGPAHRHRAQPAGAHQAQGGGRPDRRCRLAARAGGDDLPGRGRGALARPLRDPDRDPAAAPGQGAGEGGGAPMSVLELRAVSRVHGSGETAVHALRGISLTIDEGELVAVMGPSGSGKSTLLNLAGGLDAPTSGEVLVEGTDLAGLSRHALAAVRRRSAGYVFQDLNLIPALTAAENAALPRELDGVKVRTARREAIHALEEVGMDELADRFPDELSGGQQQRVAIARALVGPRRLVLADEPTGALDSTTGEMVLRLLRARCDAGASAVLVTHEARHAAWADRVVFLRDGTLVDDTGAPQPVESLLR